MKCIYSTSLLRYKRENEINCYKHNPRRQKSTLKMILEWNSRPLSVWKGVLCLRWPRELSPGWGDIGNANCIKKMMTRNQRTQESKYCFSHLRLKSEGPHINLGSVHAHSYDLTVSVAWVGSTLPLLRSHQAELQAQLGYRLIWESVLPGLVLWSSLQLRIWGSCFYPGSSSRPHAQLPPKAACRGSVLQSRAAWVWSHQGELLILLRGSLNLHKVLKEETMSS